MSDISFPVKIALNGEYIELPDGSSVENLIGEHPPRHKGFAVEVNREIVPRKKHGERALRDGDRVEIVTLVGGG